MGRLFGTDGVRGVANDELTPLLAMQLGQAGAYVLSKEINHRPTIMVGCDTRLSGDMLASALMAGACSVGADVVNVGIIPTPAVLDLTYSSACRHFNAFHVVAYKCFYLILKCIRKLVSVGIKKLDSVKLHRIV